MSTDLDPVTLEACELARLRGIEAAAKQVILNAYGTKPRHTYVLLYGLQTGHRDDCTGCGLIALAEEVDDTKTLTWLLHQRDRADARRR